jgi:hypothetical protein
MKTKIIIFLGLALFLSFSQAFSQVLLQYDTLKVIDAYAVPGDTNVTLSVYMRNTIYVGAFTLRMVYDTNLVNPRYTLQGTTKVLVASATTRSSVMELFQGTIQSPGVMTFLASNDWFPPFVYMSPGAGSVVEFKFKVKSSITQDTSALIKFQGPAGYEWSYNNFSNIGGDTTYVPILTNGYIRITAGVPGNNAPVFGALASQFEVTEGDSLGFSVSASDVDNDSITLYAETGLPANATFPTKKGKSSVNQSFVFKPDMTQGPDTIDITFAARDEHNSTTRKTVRIIVIDITAGGDLLVVSNTEGGVPGSRGRRVPIYLTNAQDIYGVQFTLEYSPALVEIDSFISLDRVNGFSIWDNLGDTPGKVTVLIFGLANEKILSGSGAIMDVSIRVDTSSTCGQDAVLTLSGAKEAISLDPNVGSLDLNMTNGLFAIDCFGDVNLDKDVDIGDVVSLVAYILESVSFSTRQLEAADINHDSTIDVGDLVGTINTILGWPIGPAPAGGSPAPLASVELNYEQLKAGEKGEVKVFADLEVAVAGAQLEINYDPKQVKFSAPLLTERSGDLIVQYKDNENGKLKAVLYSLSGRSIEPGQGDILTLPWEASSNLGNEEVKIDLKNVVLADPKAVVIPVKGQSNVPAKFSLAQNYPNPFNPQTTIRYEISGNLATPVQTTLKIYNLLGQLVRTLVDEPKSSGAYEVIWDGKDSQGEQVSSGVYFYRMTAGNFSESKKMILIK